MSEKFKAKCPACKKERYLNTKSAIYRTKNGWVGRCFLCAMKASRGKNHYKWGNGRLVPGKGSTYQYIRIKLNRDDPFYCMTCKRGYVLEHRYILAKKIGRPLTRYDCVHHLDGNKYNNSPDNVTLVSGRDHKIITHLEQKIKELEKVIKEIKKDYADFEQVVKGVSNK